MNTLVLHADTLAVTEYDTPFTGVSDDFESTSSGLYAVGGSLDGTTAIASTVTFGLQMGEGNKRQRAEYLYVFGEGLLGMTATVLTSAGASYTYSSTEQHDRSARFIPGKGIRDNYLQFQLSSAGAQALAIDQVDFMTAASTTRRL